MSRVSQRDLTFRSLALALAANNWDVPETSPLPGADARPNVSKADASTEDFMHTIDLRGGLIASHFLHRRDFLPDIPEEEEDEFEGEGEYSDEYEDGQDNFDTQTIFGYESTYGEGTTVQGDGDHVDQDDVYGGHDEWQRRNTRPSLIWRFWTSMLKQCRIRVSVAMKRSQDGSFQW